jgi:polyhydroxyalkanoate synthesis regulator phasin
MTGFKPFTQPRKIKTQDEFLIHTMLLNNFIYDSVKKGNLQKEASKKYYDLIEQIEQIFNEKWAKNNNERIVNKLKGVEQ